MINALRTRRAALLGLLVVTTTAAAAPVAKKDRERAAKSTSHGPPATPGTRPGKLINVYNQRTHEWLAVAAADLPAQATIDHFLRDHFTNKQTTIDPKLIQILIAAASQFHSDLAIVVSGFRHPKYNLMLRKKGHQVARDSQHTHGDAVDFFIPSVETRRLDAWAKAQKLGGVGIYLESGFVHMDTGKIRYWSGE